MSTQYEYRLLPEEFVTLRDKITFVASKTMGIDRERIRMHVLSAVVVQEDDGTRYARAHLISVSNGTGSGYHTLKDILIEGKLPEPVGLSVPPHQRESRRIQWYCTYGALAPAARLPVDGARVGREIGSCECSSGYACPIHTPGYVGPLTGSFV